MRSKRHSGRKSGKEVAKDLERGQEQLVDPTSPDRVENEDYTDEEDEQRPEDRKVC